MKQITHGAFAPTNSNPKRERGSDARSPVSSQMLRRTIFSRVAAAGCSPGCEPRVLERKRSPEPRRGGRKPNAPLPVAPTGLGPAFPRFPRGLRPGLQPAVPPGLLISVILATALSVPGQTASGCLSCFMLPYQSRLEKVEAANQVIVARTNDETRATWQGTVVRVIKGNDVDVDQRITIVKSKSDPMTVGDLQLIRRSALDGSWTIEGPIDRELLGFLAAGVALSTNRSAPQSIHEQSEALRYFLPYLEHAHPQIADSAYTKLAKAPYAVIRKLAADVKPDPLLAWIGDAQIASKRKSLYITLLGVCGGERESALLKQWIDEGWDRQSTENLAAMLTAHAELNGEETIRLIEQSYVQNRDRQLGELIAAVTALRVHGQADGKISRARIQASFQLLLRQRPQLVELIIEDCARWKDWSIAPKLMDIYAGGQQPWNNAMIIKYLEACPLPTARMFVEGVSATEQASNVSK
jgi:hypothetical protein